MKVVIRNKFYNITRENVKESLKGIESEEGKAKYFLEIEGKQFPIKQVLSESLGLPKLAFTSQEAFTILQRLGFEITKRS